MLKKKRCARRKQPYGRNLTSEEIDRYGPELEPLHKLWRAYNYYRLIATSQLEHRTGYISEDIYGICTRTIKKCNEELSKIEKEIDLLEAGNE